MMYDFHSYLRSLPGSPLVEAVRALYEASEGDARKYMKKMLQSLGLEQELAQGYGDNWAETAFNKIRNAFVHQGCDVYFVPGIARIAYGELDFDSDDEDTQKVAQLRRLVKFITLAHKGQFTRNLERISVIPEGPQKGMKVKSKPFTFDQLAEMFGNESRSATNADRNRFTQDNKSTDNGYKIIELKNFEQAHQFLPYCTSDPWCYLESKPTFDSYAQGGNKLYIALAPGFEKLKPGDPGYGRSMIGFDMGPVDEDGKSELCVCNNRYNHAPNLEHEEGVGTGDDAYNEIQLSKILGFPVWEKCPGYTEDELMALGRITPVTIKKLIPTVELGKKLLTDEQFRDEFAKTNHLLIQSGMAFEPNHTMSIYTVSEDGRASFDPIVNVLVTDDALYWYHDSYEVDYQHTVFTIKLLNNKAMFIKNDGTVLIDIQFDKVIHNHGQFPVGVGKADDDHNIKYNFIDKEGHFISNEWFDKIDAFRRGDEYTIVHNGDKKNIIKYNGTIVLPKWADNIEILILDRGTAVAVHYPDHILLLNSDLEPICTAKSFERIHGELFITRPDGKKNLYDSWNQDMLCTKWVDGVDDTRYTAPKNRYCYIIYDKANGYNLIETGTHRPLLPCWVDEMKYISRGLFLVVKNGKINLYDPYHVDFLLPQWCDKVVNTPTRCIEDSDAALKRYPQLANKPCYTYDPYIIDNLYIDGQKYVYFGGHMYPEQSLT